MSLARSMRAALAVALGLAGGASAEAQPRVRVSMTADRAELSMDETVTLRISVEAQSAEQPDVTLPDLDAFQVVQRSVQRPMQFSFGFGQGAPVVTSSTTYLFVLAPTGPGTFRLAPARAQLEGRTYQSEPLALTVRGGGAAPNQPPAPATEPPQAEPQAAAPPAPSKDGDAAVFDEDAFLRTVVDKTNPFEGEQVTVTMYLYTRRNLQQAPEVRSEPTTDGFWVHSLLDPNKGLEPSRQLVAGRGFWVYVLRRFAAFPLRSGELTLGAMTLRISRESVFDLFDPRRAQPSLLRSGVPVLVTAKPLPGEGRPAGEIAVGSFELTASLDRAQVATGDAVTLAATVKGRGNVRTIKLRDPALPGVEVLQPETHELVESPGDVVQGTRTFAWLLVPKTPGTHLLPELTLDVFDPAQGVYRRVTGPRLSLTAAGNAAPGAASGAAPAAPAEAAPDDGEPAATWLPIRTRSRLAGKTRALSDASFYPLLLALGPLLYLLAIVIPAARDRWRRQRAADVPGQRLRAAAQRMQKAEDAARAGDAKLFHTELAAAIALTVDARFGIAVAGVTHAQLRGLLAEAAVPQALIDGTLEVLQRADFARFGGTPGEALPPLLASARELQGALARAKRKEVR